jgi:agmatine/peptidylarginine deiminase
MIEINYWAVLAAALGNFALGSIWYSPLAFGNKWMHYMGWTQQDMESKKKGVGKSYALMFIGTLITTRQCLLNPNRNAGLSQQDIEQRLDKYFGARRVLWLDQENLSGDDTDAHIDTLARFCTADTIAYTSSNNPTDKHFNSLKNMAAQLHELRTQSGKPYQLIPLPMPAPIYDEEGQRLPANYANFLVINGAVMVPAYDDPMDDIARQRLAGCFPDREIIATPCRPLVHQYGSLHCMTMQFTAGALGVGA